MQNLSKMPTEFMLALKDKLETNKPLTELDRAVLITLLSKKTVGRPKGSDTKTLQHIKLYLKYVEKYSPSTSESAFEEVKEMFGYKNVSSAKKAVTKIRDMIDSMKENGIKGDDDMLGLVLAIIYSPYHLIKEGEDPNNIQYDILPSILKDSGK